MLLPGAALVLSDLGAWGPARIVRVAGLSEGVRGLDPIVIRGARDDRDAGARRRDPRIGAVRTRLVLDD